MPCAASILQRAQRGQGRLRTDELRAQTHSDAHTGHTHPQHTRTTSTQPAHSRAATHLARPAAWTTVVGRHAQQTAMVSDAMDEVWMRACMCGTRVRALVPARALARVGVAAWGNCVPLG
eukprot:15459119-Alexandrium_andersonii.AAC.1